MNTTIKKGTTFRHRKAKCLTADGSSTDQCVVTCVHQGVAHYRFVNEEKSTAYIRLDQFEQYAEDIQ